MTARICRLCGGTDLHRALDFGPLPLGYPVDPDEVDPRQVWSATLALDLCRTCRLLGTLHAVPESQMIQENRYASGVSRHLADYEDRFVEEMTSRYGLGPSSAIMEIGCSDGSQLSCFSRRGFTSLFGVEPSPSPGTSYPAEMVHDFFTLEVAQRCLDQGWSPEFIYSNHVLDQVTDLSGFLNGVHRLLSPDGHFAVEVPYLFEILDKKRIDAFSHIKCHWFSLTSLAYAFSRHGFTIDTVLLDPLHRDGNIRIVASRTQGRQILPSEYETLLAMEADRFQSGYFAELGSSLENLRHELLTTLGTRASSRPLVVYGGGIKAAMLLNWLGLDFTRVAFAVDRDPAKQGRLIPLANIPIHPLRVLEELTRPVDVLNLALDHAKEVQLYLKSVLSKGSSILFPLPRVLKEDIS